MTRGIREEDGGYRLREVEREGEGNWDFGGGPTTQTTVTAYGIKNSEFDSTIV